MNNVTEWLANLSYTAVCIVIVVLIGVRYVLLKYKAPWAKSLAETAESLAIAMGLVFLIIRPFFVQAFYIPSPSMEPTLLGHKEPTPIHDHILVNKTVYRLRDPRHGDIVVFKAPPEALAMSGTLSPAENAQADYIKRVVGVPGDEIEVKAGYITVNGRVYNHRDLHRALSSEGANPENMDVKIKNDGIYIDGVEISEEKLASDLGDDKAKIEAHPGYVIRNGKRLNEPYIAEDPEWDYPDPSDPITGSALEKAVARGKLKLLGSGDNLRIKLMPGELLMMGDNRNNSSDSRFWGPLDRDRVIGRAMFIFWPLNRIRWVR